MKYLEFLNILQNHAEADFADFQKRLIFTPRKILGVRTPIMRKIAKENKWDLDELFSYPNEYYETAFIKLTVAANLPYPQFLERLDSCVQLIDNWALCDSFKCKAIARHRQEFLSVIETLFNHGTEFYQRYALVSLLNDYVYEEYIDLLRKYMRRAKTEFYYVHMAVAWLLAEILIKCYDNGVLILQDRLIDEKTHNKGIQKALESFRLTKEQKDFLRSLKIKENR